MRGRSRVRIRHDVIRRIVPNLNVRDASAGHDFYVDFRDPNGVVVNVVGHPD
jgi:hypothetical protein